MLFVRCSLVLLACWAPLPAEAGVQWQINEVLAHHQNPDRREFVEIAGPKGASLDGLLFCQVSGTAPSAGTLTLALDLTGANMPADGLFVIGGIDEQEQDAYLGSINALGNATVTFYLLETSDPGAVLAFVGQNLDPDGDGTTLLPTVASILDQIALITPDYVEGEEWIYDGTPTVGPHGNRAPPGALRSGPFREWCQRPLDFDREANLDLPATPGLPNEDCLSPKLLAWDAHPADGLGQGVAFDGQHVLTSSSSPNDRLYRFDLQSGHQVEAVSPSDWGLPRFSGPLDQQEGRLLVGLPLGGHATGRAFLVNLAQPTAAIELVPPGPGQGTYFGSSLSLSSQQAVLGNPWGAQGRSAYLFDAQGTFLTRLTSEGLGGSSGDFFGYSVAINEHVVAVGAPSDATSGENAGAAYVFLAQAGYDLVRRIVPSDVQPGDRFGSAVALSGSQILIGTQGADAGYLYDWATGARLHKLEAIDGTPPPLFGIAVELSGDLALIGGNGGTPNNRGEVHAYRASTGAPLRVFSPITPASSGYGRVLGAHGSTLLVTDSRLDENGLDAGGVIVERAGVGDSYCRSQPNSTGDAAVIAGWGESSVAMADLTLSAAPVPPLEAGLFFFGTSQLEVPFGNGFRCVGGDMTFRFSPQQASAPGVLESSIRYGSPPGILLQPGTTWMFQAWFRDPAIGAGFDLSDGLQVRFTP